MDNDCEMRLIYLSSLFSYIKTNVEGSLCLSDLIIVLTSKDQNLILGTISISLKSNILEMICKHDGNSEINLEIHETLDVMVMLNMYVLYLFIYLYFFVLL